MDSGGTAGFETFILSFMFHILLKALGRSPQPVP